MTRVAKYVACSAGYLLIASPISAFAQGACNMVKPGNYWFELNQSNGYFVKLLINVTGARTPEQVPRHTVGFDAWVNKQPEGPNFIKPDGHGEGTINPTSSMILTIHWNGGAEGRYTATSIVAGGKVSFEDGQTRDLAHPDSRATWRSPSSLLCAP